MVSLGSPLPPPHCHPLCRGGWISLESPLPPQYCCPLCKAIDASFFLLFLASLSPLLMDRSSRHGEGDAAKT